jgi:NTE family protein
VKHHRLRHVIDYLLEDQNIEDTQIPFAAVAVDLIQAETMVFRQGSIRLAVDASSSLPGYFSPVEYDGKLLVDGAVLQVVPVPVAKALGAEFIIAVNVSQNLEQNPDLDNVIKIIFRSSAITNNYYNQSLIEKADIILKPSVGHLHWSEFDHLQVAISKGEEIAYKALPLLKRTRKHAQKRNIFPIQFKKNQKIIEMNKESPV